MAESGGLQPSNSMNRPESQADVLELVREGQHEIKETKTLSDLTDQVRKERAESQQKAKGHRGSLLMRKGSLGGGHGERGVFLANLFHRGEKVAPETDEEAKKDSSANPEEGDEEAPLLKKGEVALVGSGTEEDAERHAFTLVMMSATLFALWGTDLYELCGPPTIGNDTVLYTLSTVVFFCFMIEFCFYTLFKPGYVGSFFFYLDFVAAVSLLPDMLLLWDVELFGSSGGGLAVARAGRAARAGTRAARVVRIFKLFSLIRRGKKKKQAQDGEPSKVGTKLNNGIINKVIIIVALMLISSQLLDLISTAEEFASTQAQLSVTLESLQMLLAQSTNGSFTDPSFYHVTVQFIEQVNGQSSGNCPNPVDFPTVGPGADTFDCKLRFLKVGGQAVWGTELSWVDLRTTPTEFSKTSTDSDANVLVIEKVQSARDEALVNILTVAFITVLLAIASALFSRDSDRLVIGPLEIMARLVRNLAKDPLGAVSLNEDDESMDSETKFVAQAILKLSTMLQVGFGEAGATIIRANMANESPTINPIVPGRRIMGIYAFCDIRNFTDCTECLQEDVMVFVNRCAHFVHRAVKDNDGAPNKNIGDAFLCAWTVPERTAGKKESGQLSDGALKSILRIVIETAADPQLTELTNRPAVQNRIPGYYTKFGFGLHLGWGIEGAIGSVLKIDATYLSPNVNMSARLEGATKTYGCLLLMTDSFYDTLSGPVQKLCRRVDRVTAVGSNVPFDLYTYDAVRFPDLDTMQRGSSFWERFPPTTSDTFRNNFADGVKAYIGGDWQEARGCLQKCVDENDSDGPTKFLMSFMGESDFHSPAKWNGYRINGVD